MSSYPKFKLELDDNIPGSKFFTWAEALWLPQVQAYAVPTFEQETNIIKQAAYLDNVREHFDSPVTVTSWLRPKEYNKMIGGAPSSMHILGLATDFVVKGISCDDVKAELRANPLIYPGRGEIDTTNWVHLDLKPGGWFYARGN